MRDATDSSLVGIPCLAYGLGQRLLIKFEEEVPTDKGIVRIFFLTKEEGNNY